ncbi:hypothetical protein GCM10009850_079890 [Nonomuraea monospora]|uniref:Secreted protein n=1 Tax=Nonomuraea monospora TaxID=568818 RepID=A0ABN3CSV7_9ACTN
MRPAIPGRFWPPMSRHKAAISTVSAAVAALAVVLVLSTASSAATGSDAASAQAVTRGATVCAGPINVSLGSGEFLAANGSSFDSNTGAATAVNWTVRRGELINANGGTTFFTAATVIRSARTAQFQVTVPAGDPSLPGSIWVCGSASLNQPARMEMTLNKVGA